MMVCLLGKSVRQVCLAAFQVCLVVCLVVCKACQVCLVVCLAVCQVCLVLCQVCLVCVVWWCAWLCLVVPGVPGGVPSVLGCMPNGLPSVSGVHGGVSDVPGCA